MRTSVNPPVTARAYLQLSELKQHEMKCFVQQHNTSPDPGIETAIFRFVSSTILT